MDDQTYLNTIVMNRLMDQISTWDKESLEDFFRQVDNKFNTTITTEAEFTNFFNTTDSDNFADGMDDILDELASMDAFGSEQQCDPRGDFRNSDWSMWDVEE
jgi:hypothetical protein